ncbi:type II toxin-antitoxin system RelE/ParE family toxin [Candidatus Pacearchaeota archaeon]|nr:type II toxin-antitoxin system RelE/ParE family toxin [Candidatus Pacearchaeota archaeon]
MPYFYRISKNLDRILEKLLKKDKEMYEQVLKKIDEIINSYDIEHYKNLRYNLKDSKRVHVGHFVLVFQYDKKENTILFDDFEHHDKIYGKK